MIEMLRTSSEGWFELNPLFEACCEGQTLSEKTKLLIKDILLIEEKYFEDEKARQKEIEKLMDSYMKKELPNPEVGDHDA